MQVTFNPGQTSQTVTVTVVGDNTAEPDETFDVILSGASGGNIADGTGVGTIEDDDSGGGGGGGNGGGGGGGGGGGCNGKGNKPGCGVEEIEMQDPIWWFEGTEADLHHHHHHEHDHHPLPHESFNGIDELALAVAGITRMDPAAASLRSESLIDRSLPELVDQVFADPTRPAIEDCVDDQHFVGRNFNDTQDDELDAVIEDVIGELEDELVSGKATS